MQAIMEYLGIVTALLLGIAGLLHALTLVVKRLPIAAQSLRELFSKKGWVSTRIRINGPLDDSNRK